MLQLYSLQKADGKNSAQKNADGNSGKITPIKPTEAMKQATSLNATAAEKNLYPRKQKQKILLTQVLRKIKIL